MPQRSLQLKEEHQEQAKNAAIALRLNQNAIALRLGCSRQPVSRFFNGKPVSNELFVGICGVLKLDWQEVTGSYTAENQEDIGVVNQSADHSDNLGNSSGDVDRETRISNGNYNETIQGNYINVAGNYIQHQPTGDQTLVNKSQDIETLVTQLRQQVKQDIETRCGKMRIFDTAVCI